MPTTTGVVDVIEEVVDSTPFGSLLRFRKDTDVQGPRVLILAPLSGHFATLLTDTVETMLPDHDVYITDWANAREVPVSEGRFGFDEYVDHVVRFLNVLGPGAHLLAVCQPCVQALIVTAVMAESGDPCVPRTLTLMAGPIDTRINPTAVNDLATTRPIEWFEQNVISTVPWRFPGAGRRVYPGFMQLTAFLSMNMPRHIKSHFELYQNLADGNLEEAAATREFYDEYFAVLDLTAEFYLETVEKVFQTQDLARGVLQIHGRTVDPSAIRKTMLLTVEGERDDICSIGQTMAAHDLCSGLSPHAQAPPPAGRRGPLRRVQRPALEDPGVPGAAQHDRRPGVAAAIPGAPWARGRCHTPFVPLRAWASTSMSSPTASTRAPSATSSPSPATSTASTAPVRPARSSPCWSSRSR